MCITSTARRRSLTLTVLPSHLLTSSTAAAAASYSKTETATEAADSAEAPETRPTSSSFLKPLLPTKTNKKSKKSPSSSSSQIPHHDGLVVQHHYHDHSSDPVVDPTLIKHKAKGGVIIPFPVKLHDMLDRIEADGLAHVVSWQPHGRCFVVHKPKEFVNHVMPHYFKQTKMASFQRQLNLYGFNRLTSGLDKGGYYHEMFLKGKVSLAYDIQRMRVKGTGVRLPTNPDNEPNFYALPPVSQMDQVSMPPLPPPMVSSAPVAGSGLFVNMAQRRAELLLESHDHSQRIAKARRQHDEGNDVVFFEGLPFHYLDPSALPRMPEPAKQAKQQQPKLAKQVQAPPSPMVERQRPVVAHSSSTVVSESESDHEKEEDVLLPSFSPSNMDWDGPLSSPMLQAHMMSSSFQTFSKEGSLVERPLEEDIESFFQGFEMPVDLYHEQIEQMEDDDDTAFGYLLEQAISE